MMQLEDQVVSLELAKRLKELGVRQESLFYWSDYNGRFGVYHENRKMNTALQCQDYSAFTVAELGEMLPDWQETVKRADKDWVCIIRHKHNDINDHSFSDTEANARALMLIHLIENKLIEAPK